MSSGSITVITGSMFAGKSEELIRLAREAASAGKPIQVFKPSIDTRFPEEMVVTHSGERHPAQSVNDVDDLRMTIRPETRVIFVDEAQFFDVPIVQLVVDLADKGREVICAGLDQDFRREPFGQMPQLMAVADRLIKLRAVCALCGAPASHTYRRNSGQDEPIVLIGGGSAYEARCRTCYDSAIGH